MTLRLGNKKVCPTKLVKVNNVDFSKISLVSSYSFSAPDNSTSIQLYNGRLWMSQPNDGFYPRGSSDETQATKFVNFSQPFEINVKFTAPTDTTRNHVIFGNGYTGQYFHTPASEFMYTNGDTILWCGLSSNGSSWNEASIGFDTSEISRVVGDIYECNYKYDGSKYTVTVKHNDEVATKSVNVTGTPYYSSENYTNGSYFSFAKNANNYNTSFYGGWLYLDNTYIKQNGVLVWGCEAGQNYIEVDPNNYLISNVTKVGAVEDNKGVLSGFTVSDYAKNNPLSISSTEDLSVVTKFTAGNEVSSNYVILDWMYQTNTDNTALRLYISNGRLIWQINSSDNTHIVDNFMGSNIIANTTYYAKFYWDSTNNLWTCSISTDGTNWITETTASGGMIGNIVQIDWGRWFASNFTFNGSIDLNECYVISGGQTVWQGVVPQGSRG